jgi:UPF0042 nucleotide-binding protein
MSGAGKTSVLKALEDLECESIDHVPLSMLRRLLPAAVTPRQSADKCVAIGIDVRTRDFGVEALLREIDRLSDQGHMKVTMVFMDCDNETLYRRYTETRHLHPLALDRPVVDGIALERNLLFPLRNRADVVIDTTALAPGQLKHILEGHFGPRAERGLNLFVTSFGFRRGLPRDADLVFDVRFLANPHYNADLKPLTGTDEAVAEFIRGDEAFELFFKNLTSMLEPLLPRYAAEGKSYLTIAIGCTGGRHRSVYVSERLAQWLRDRNFHVNVHHRDLGRPNT